MKLPWPGQVWDGAYGAGALHEIRSGLENEN